MMKSITIAAAILGLTSVMMGAAGDHLLQGKLTPETAETFDVALHYHQLYAILIFATGLYGLKENLSRFYRWSAVLFLSGTVIFCGSLYASLFTGIKTLTYLTPIGGLTLMAAWITAIFAVKNSE